MRFLLVLTLVATTALAQEREGRGGRDGEGAARRAGAATVCAVSILGSAFVLGASDWHVFNGGLDPVPAITANAGDGPPGSCTAAATRMQIAAGAQAYSMLTIATPPASSGSQMCSGTTSNISWGFWAKCTATRTLDMRWVDNSNGGQIGTCSVTANTWTFCKLENKTFWLTSNEFALGNMPLFNGGTDRGSLDCMLYAPRCVAAATISP